MESNVLLTNSFENFNRKIEYFSRKHICLSVICRKSSYLPIIEKWRRKKSIKIDVKARNWTVDETALLCEILVDPMNEFKLFVIVFNLNCL